MAVWVFGTLSVVQLFRSAHASSGQPSGAEAWLTAFVQALKTGLVAFFGTWAALYLLPDLGVAPGRVAVLTAIVMGCVVLIERLRR